KFLFGAAMEYIQENDFQKAWLSTFSESEIAIAFYKRRGFRIMVETDVEIGGKNYHEIVMEKSFLT
ncbi:GNAT family N-acetyltransferase, partial [Parasutterella excrementihominis]